MDMGPSSLQQQHQEIMASQSLDSMLASTRQQGQDPQRQSQNQLEKKPRPPEQAQKCPRCDSANTKFCYYNNYSLTQPRYFCKSCRRYWTKGGTLRNVPVGGGCRKNRRSSSSSSSSSSSASRRSCTPDHHQPHHLITTTHFDHHNQASNDLSLAFARLQKYDNHGNNLSLLGNPSVGGGNPHFDLLGNSFLDTSSTTTTTTQSLGGLQHLYYAHGGYENGGGGGNSVNVNRPEDDHHHHHQMGMQFDHHNDNQGTGPIKQELGESRVLWGLPWQLNGASEANYMNVGGGNELDLLRESWNSTGVLGSSWHSLLNSPLM